MRLIENEFYLNSLKKMIRSFPHWDRLCGKAFLISGVSGMIGSVLTDAIFLRNELLTPEERTMVIGVGRSKAAAEERFPFWINCPEFRFLEHDVSYPFEQAIAVPDYVIHAASTTHPVAYASNPIDTILTNVQGTRNLLDICSGMPQCRFLLLSSVEIYGENRGDTSAFDEMYCGYLNCNTLRAGYPEAKRVSEALCQAYIEEKDVDAVILRLPRCYGPSMRMSDSKAIAQFIKKAVSRENIILKSEGKQFYSYAYVFDAVLGILWTLCCGNKGEAYNLSDQQSNIALRDLAELAARSAGTNVVIDLPDTVEQKGYSTASIAILDSTKLRRLGWKPEFDLSDGLRETIQIVSELEEKGR